MLALVDMLFHPRSGLAKYAPFFSRLAPLFYAPRVMDDIPWQMDEEIIYHIRFPLGKENWHQLTPQVRESLLRQLRILCANAGGLCLAADRRFRLELQGQTEEQFIFFGDIFRVALMLFFVEQYLQKHHVRRVIFVTETNHGLEGVLDYLNRTGTPLMLQSLHPSRHEPFCWRMLHEKGMAVSCGALRPQEWEKDDLVIGFQADIRKLVNVQPKMKHFILDDNSSGWAPELEQRAVEAGLDGSLAVLAPLLEYHLLKEQPEMPSAVEMTCFKDWEALLQDGEKAGLWRAFLDKDEARFI